MGFFSVVSVACFLAGVTLPILLKIFPGLLALLAVLLVVRKLVFPTERSDSGLPYAARLGKRHVVLLGAILAVVIGLTAYSGPLITYRTDSYDHLSTVREILDSGELFPSNTFHVGGIGTGPDPRKGTYHVLLALSCLAGKADPFDLWRWLPAILSPLLVLTVFVFAETVFKKPGMALLASALFVLTYGGTFPDVLRATGLPLEIGIQLFWASLGLFFLYARSRRRSFLVFGATVAAAASSVHIYPFFQTSLALIFCFLCSALRRGFSNPFTRSLLTAGIVTAAMAAPLLAFRYTLTYAPENPIHLSMMGVLLLGGKIAVTNPLAAFRQIGLLGVVSFLFLGRFLRDARHDDAALYMAAALLAPLLIGFNPLIVPRVEPSYIFTRTFRLVPYFLVGTWGLFRYFARERGRRPPASNIVLGIVILLSIVSYVPSRTDAYTPRRIRVQKLRSPLAWRNAFAEIERKFPGRSVILSDPITSYCLTAFTSKHVVCTLDQHSSPNDPLALKRIADAQTVLSPYNPPEATRRLLVENHVNYVLLNDNFRRVELGYQWSVHPGLQNTIRKRFDTLMPMLRKVFDEGGFVMYSFSDTTPEVAVTEFPNPHLVGCPEEACLDPPVVFDSKAELVGLSYSAARIRPGDTLQMVTYWKNLEAVGGSSPRQMVLRLDREGFEGRLYSEAYGKIYRKLLEKVTRRKYRLRLLRQVTDGVFPIYMWPDGETVKDSLSVPIPISMYPGRYAVKVKLMKQPFYVNIRLRDLFRNDDLFDGPVVATIRIE